MEKRDWLSGESIKKKFCRKGKPIVRSFRLLCPTVCGVCLPTSTMQPYTTTLQSTTSSAFTTAFSTFSTEATPVVAESTSPASTSLTTPATSTRPSTPARGPSVELVTVDKNMVWIDAEEHCQNLGGHLATFADVEERDLIRGPFLLSQLRLERIEFVMVK